MFPPSPSTKTKSVKQETMKLEI